MRVHVPGTLGTYIIYSIYRQQILMPPIDEYYNIVNGSFFVFGHIIKSIGRATTQHNKLRYYYMYYVYRYTLYNIR